MATSSSIALTSIGVTISYAVGGTSTTTKPTGSFTKITGLKSTPDFNPTPNTADVTTFENQEYTSKIDLLKEMPDTLDFTAVLSQAFYDKWASFVTAYTSSTITWLCIDINGLDKSIFVPVKPVKMGLPSVDVNSAIEVTVSVVPLGEPIFDVDPTYATA